MMYSKKLALAVFITAVIFSVCLIGADKYEDEKITQAIIGSGEEASEATESAHTEISDDMFMYPECLRILYQKNPEARAFVLSYPEEKDKIYSIDISEYENSKTVPHFLQWDARWGFLSYGDEYISTAGCGPVCVSMVGYYLTGNADIFSPEKVAAFADNNGYFIKDVGTAWSLMDEGAEYMGLDAEILPLNEGLMAESIQKGKPLILSMGPGAFTSTGHFIVVHGYENGRFLINDPNSVIRTQKSWSFSEFSDQVRNIWAYSFEE